LKNNCRANSPLQRKKWYLLKLNIIVITAGLSLNENHNFTRLLAALVAKTNLEDI